MPKKLFLSLMLVLLFLGTGNSADYYVTLNGAGSANGSDWSNALAWTFTPSRDNVYYIAGGLTYGAKTLSAAASGTSTIVLRKATSANSGSVDGWQSSYADQAVLGLMTVSTNYWEIDGVSRNESNWQQTSSYGFSLIQAGGANNQGITIGENANNLVFKYMAVGVSAANSPSVGVKMTVYGETWGETFYFGYMHIYNVGVAFHSRGKNNATIEKSHIGPTYAKEAISHQRGHNWIIRWNKWVDTGAGEGEYVQTAAIGVFNYTGGGPAVEAYSDDWEIYGNVFSGTGAITLDAAEAWIYGNEVNDWKFWNNTISRTDGNWAGTVKLIGTGNSIKNNLWYWMGDYDAENGSIVQATGADYSWCYYKNPNPAKVGGDCSNLPNTVYDGTEDPFVNESTGDYNLKAEFAGVSPLAKGENLGAYPYNVDLYGNTRPATGAWDIGATQYSEGTPSISAPSGLKVVGGFTWK